MNWWKMELYNPSKSTCLGERYLKHERHFVLALSLRQETQKKVSRYVIHRDRYGWYWQQQRFFLLLISV
jgi:hypothetical protein